MMDSTLQEWIWLAAQNSLGRPWFIHNVPPNNCDPTALKSALKNDIVDFAAILDTVAKWMGPQRQIMCWSDEDYPPLLRQISNPPPVLFISGDRSLLSQTQLAIVGSRNPTPVGLDNARQFAASLAGMGVVITSGMALGIDAAAHEGALQAKGRTIAVAGTGVDRIYPASHKKLAHAIVDQGGVLVSEFLLGTPPNKFQFPRRNRLISGLSIGTLVVEAALSSGSLITAREAIEQGREVFAIPGSIHNPLAKGCHQLIRQGAKLVETAEHILEELGGLLVSAERTVVDPTHSLQSFAPDNEHKVLLDAMGFDPVGVDELIGRSGLSAQAVTGMLLTLELNDVIASVPGGYLRKR